MGQELKMKETQEQPWRAKRKQASHDDKAFLLDFGHYLLLFQVVKSCKLYKIERKFSTIPNFEDIRRAVVLCSSRVNSINEK